MASTAFSFFSDFAAAVNASPIGPVLHEVLVLTVFGVSFLLWRAMRPAAPRRTFTKGKLDAKLDAKEFQSEQTSALRRRTSNFEAQAKPETRQLKNSALEQSMQHHLDNREFTRALNLFRSCERDGRLPAFSEELYSTFIQAAIRVGKLDVVERMLRSMRSSGLNPSCKCWQTTFRMLSSRKHFSMCLQVYSIFGKDMEADKVSLSCLVNAALEIGQAEQAGVILEQYAKVQLEAKDYVLFFRTYQSLNDADAAEAVFRKLGKETSNLMFNLLLLTCVNNKDPERALRLLQEAHELQTPGAAASECMVDVVSYNTVIKGFARDLNAQQCFACLNQMQDYGLQPDPITFGTLLDLCIADNHLEIADEIVKLLLQSHRELDTVVCTLFLKGLVKANCLDRAIALYEEMKQRQGARPDVITFSVLIKALVDHHDLTRAFACFEDMKVAGHRPDDIIYTHLLEGCRHAGQHARGKDLFQSMLDQGVKPSEFTLVTMLKLHGRCGFHQEAFDLVAGWDKEHGMKPSVIHFTCLVSGCLRTKSYEQAWQAYDLMRSCGVKPDGMALSTLLPGLVAAQQWERVAALAEVATSGPSSLVPAETLCNAHSQMVSNGAHPRLIDRLRQCMEAAGVQASRRIGSTMGAGMWRGELSQRAPAIRAC